MVQGAIGSEEVKLQLCTCDFPQDMMTTTTNVKNFLQQLALRQGYKVHTDDMRLTAEGETRQSLRELLDGSLLSECMPPGGTLFFRLT